MPRKLRYNSKFNEFLRYTIGIFLDRRYSLQVEHKDLIDGMEAPYVILPNHVSFWDPFFVSYFIPKPVFYVVSDMQFRRPIIRILLSLVGAIPKSKAVSDFETVRNIFRIKQRKGIIGIFPEGRRNWDGHSNLPLFATAKLIKALKLPVIIPLLKGAYLSLPRWSRDHKKGAITVDFREGFSIDELKVKSVDEIHSKLSELIVYDEWAYQRGLMMEFKNRHRAEHVELTLFICPECNNTGKLRSHRHTLSCSSCGYTVIYNTFGFFETETGEPKFDTVRSWNLWQLEYIRSRIERAKDAESKDPIISDGPVWVRKGYRTEFMKKLERGRLSLFADRLEVSGNNGNKTLTFHIDQVRGVNVQLYEILEFYYGEDLYSFHFKNIWVSGYKWMVALNILRGEDAFSSDFLD